MTSDRATPSVTRRRLLTRGAALSAGGLAVSRARGQRESATAATQQRGGDQQSLSCDSTVAGELTPDNESGFRGERYYQDEYTFAGEAGQFVSISMQTRRRESRDRDDGMTDEPPADDGDPYLYLLGPDGAVVAEDDDSADGRDAFLSVRSLPATGTYTVIATSFAADETFEYALELSCGSPLDPVTIQCDDIVTGALTADDETGFLGPGHVQDSYVFEAEAGAVVQVTMSAVDSVGADDAQTTADPFLLLLDPDGSLLGFDDDSGDDLNASLTATLVTGGEYTVVATSFAPRQYFGYELSVSCRSRIDAEPIDCGQTITGQLTPADASGVRTAFGEHYHDAYAFDGEQGEQVTLVMDARRRNGSGDPYLLLFGPDGTVIAEDDDCGGALNALVRRRLPTDGRYVVVATSFDAESTFAYDLTLTCGNVPVPLPGPTILDCGDRRVGELSPDDAAGFRGPEHFHDSYEFEGSVDDFVTLSLSASNGDPYLYLLDPDDSIVAEDDDGGGTFDALLRNYRLQQSGTYTVVATSFHQRAFFEYNIGLQCRSTGDTT